MSNVLMNRTTRSAGSPQTLSNWHSAFTGLSPSLAGESEEIAMLPYEMSMALLHVRRRTRSTMTSASGAGPIGCCA